MSKGRDIEKFYNIIKERKNNERLVISGLDLSEIYIKTPIINITFSKCIMDGAIIANPKPIKFDEESDWLAEESNEFALEAELNEVEFSETSLINAMICDARIAYTRFDGSLLDGMVVNNAHIECVSIKRCNAAKISFLNVIGYNLVITNSNMGEARIEDVRIINSTESACICGVNMEKASIRNSSLHLRSIDSSSFVNSRIESTRFSNGDNKMFLWGVDFSRAVIRDTHISNSYIDACNFSETILHNVEFSGSEIHDTIFYGAKTYRQTSLGCTSLHKTRGIIIIQPCGSRLDTLVIISGGKGEKAWCSTGCFNDYADTFLMAANEKHGDNIYSRTYRAFIGAALDIFAEQLEREDEEKDGIPF